MRKLTVLIVLILLVVAAGGTGVVWDQAGRVAGPVIVFTEPATVGRIGEFVMTIETPRGELNSLEVTLEQNGATLPVFSLSGGDTSALVREGSDRLVLRQPLGKERFESLLQGPASIAVTAARPVLFGYREAETAAGHDFEVSLRPPLLGVQSQFHYVNHGGSEVVVYRVTPADAVSGVRVGEHEYPGFPAAGAGMEGADPSIHVAFLALLWDQELATPITVFARDSLGNEASATFAYRTFAQQFRESRINLSDGFFANVVPAILQNSPDFRVDDPSDLLASYLSINRDMRRENDAYIAALSRETSPEILWQGPFKQLINTAVESGFADQRDYYYDGEVVDHQTHLGFDLASTVAAPVLAANRGRVVHSGWLGIYGNCVILDHGMGLQSLYAHLSSVDVGEGDLVELDEQLGRSGATGLAGGDHLHFTMLLNGNAITPIDWWSAQWVEDRILRKFREAGEPAAAL
ncbi:M23 family metallopeptidase [Candidatus Rariloculus sp.]|uniref:M23 family metallopeptidase n=1 Tax=Candidatus Rariloculus sp. TaxID=3101265 RepID=UPI003D120126